MMRKFKLEEKKEQLNNLGDVLFYHFDEENHIIYAKSENEGFVSISFEVYNDGKGVFQTTYISEITIQI